MILHGDCLSLLREFDDAFVDTIVTDPPYGLAFMGKKWDYDVPSVEVWREALRVTKPGGFLLCFGGTRTYHRMACAIEDAGWEIRDCIMWLYGSGFPKSLDISKAIDKAAGAEREVVGMKADPRYLSPRRNSPCHMDRAAGKEGGHGQCHAAAILTAPSTDDAKTWNGWGTALKPAYEPIIVAMKPLDGTFASNALTHGVAGLNIDGCRIPTNDNLNGGAYAANPTSRDAMWGEEAGNSWRRGGAGEFVPPTGRWPANVILDEEAGATFEESRFFYCAKASKKDRGPDNNHPTVKPIELMRYLVRLTKTPTGGLVLDPFAGSGTTGVACKLEGREFIGIEREEAYVAIAERRLAA